MCDLGKGSTRDRHHSPQNEEMEEYRSPAQAIRRGRVLGRDLRDRAWSKASMGWSAFGYGSVISGK